jgi:hypothetical protein
MTQKLSVIFLRIALVFFLIAPPAAFLDFFLPHHSVLRVVGTQVKHTGTDVRSGTSQRAVGGHDVYYIFAEDIESKKPRVFRNEDTRWGFPWYFKFNSADIQAAAQSIADDHGTAIITYYGWRMAIFSLFPNVTKVVRAEPDARPIPWFNLAFFAVIISIGAWLALMISRIRKRRLKR